MSSESQQAVLRPMTDSDGDFLYRLYASTRADEMAMVNWSDLQKQEFLQMQFRAQTSHYAEHYPLASFDIIELDNNPIGRLYLDKQADELRIIDIALLSEYRSRGIGRYYLESIIEQARDQGRSVSIHVEHNNPAMSLYRRLGFVKIEDKGIYWFMRWSPSTAVQEKTAS
jgi:ribosomal protein S18 acetylase RimI-like enzyme